MKGVFFLKKNLKLYGNAYNLRFEKKIFSKKIFRFENKGYKNKTILIIGNCKFSFKLAHEFKAREARVIVLVDTDENNERIETDDIEVLTCNLSNPESIKNLMDYVAETIGYIDVFINNYMSFERTKTFFEINEDVWNKSREQGIAIYFLLQYVVKLMIRHNKIAYLVCIGNVYTEHDLTDPTTLFQYEMEGYCQGIALNFAKEGIVSNRILVSTEFEFNTCLETILYLTDKNANHIQGATFYIK